MGYWRPRREAIALLLIFLAAFSLRLHFQSESAVDNPFRADAGKYVRAAYNLWAFGVHSEDPPSPDLRPPEHRTDLAPGYPLFLSALLDEESIRQPASLVARVGLVQASLGSLTVVLVFLIARMIVALPWAAAAGGLAALSPHLIAVDGCSSPRASSPSS